MLLHEGRVGQRFRKSLLPTYDVFDEDRYFEPYHGAQILELGGRRLGISICEDVWNDRDFWKRRRYHHDPIEELMRAGADAIVNLSASPFSVGKHRRREEMLGSMARKHHVPVVYVNQFGGNDDLVFDGRSLGFNADGTPIARGRSFEPDVVICDLARGGAIAPADDESAESEIWRALVLGTRDYVRKCGFSHAVLGLSGGIDSALTAAIAVEAIGPDHVLGVLMPSPYSSRGSIEDATELATRLGIRTLTLPIEPAMRAMEATLAPAFEGCPRDVTEENIQARIRGNLLMALSNKRQRAAAHHRKQIGAVGRLLHAVRRHVRRAGRDCRRAEDDGVPDRAMAERDAWARRDPRTDIDQGTVGRAQAEPDRSGFAAAVRRARRHPAAPHRTASTRRRDHRRRLRPGNGPPRAADGAPRRIQAQAGRARD